ncbi:MAG TPA: methyltransferase domain-containing protein [Acidimicrobiales bacterium]|nr:methyltransferase domain-containing protein [Acidimicrobiales bacterium]
MTEQQALAWRVPTARLRTHNAIVDRLGLAPGAVFLDLGCGNGFTLATAASRVPDLTLIGLDVDEVALAAARSWLEDLGARHELLRADVGDRLPLPSGSVTHVVCHDVLENLEDPLDLMVEAHRVLVAGGTSVWSHVDYDSVVVSGADRHLTRRVVQAYGEASREGMDRTDAQMGRKVAALVAQSPLERAAVDAHVLIATDLEGPGERRIEDMAATVRRSAERGEADVDVEDVDTWVAQLRLAHQRARFFYAQTAYIVTATKRG